MDALITGEDDGGIGLSVIDNNDVEHLISVDFDGEITYHEQDGYPDDPDERTTRGQELVLQTRRFAKFYVYRKRGYETVPAGRNPDRIALLALAVGSMSEDALLSTLGAYFQQLLHYEAEADAVVETPEIPSGEITWLEKDIYLDPANDRVAQLTDQLAGAEILADIEDSAGTAAEVVEILAEQGIDVQAEARALGEAYIDAHGPLNVWWKDGPLRADRQSKTARGTGSHQIPDRDHDVRLQMFANVYPLDGIDTFRGSVIQHLRCQIRDCYIGMGIAPPEDARVQGPGIYDYIGFYKAVDFYPRYNDTRVDIDYWQEEHTPDDLGR
jgi:hypothetical protein